MRDVYASDGELLPLDSLTINAVYSSGALSYYSVTHKGNEYRQTLTYTSGNVTSISRWTKQ